MVWGAVAAVAGSIISSNAQKKSAKNAANAAREGVELSKQEFAPYRKAGLSALGQYLDLLGLDSRVAREVNPDSNVQQLLDMGYSESQAVSLAKGKPVKGAYDEATKTRIYQLNSRRAVEGGDQEAEAEIARIKQQSESQYQSDLAIWDLNRKRPTGTPIGTVGGGGGGGGGGSAPALPGSTGQPLSRADMVRQMIESDPGYQATIDMATQQTSRTAAAQGRASGGGFLGDLYQQNAQIAGDFYQKRLANLSGLINVGSGAGAATAAATSRAAEIQATGQLAVGQANANMWGNIGSIAGQYFGSQQGGAGSSSGSSTSSGMTTSGANAGQVFGG